MGAFTLELREVLEFTDDIGLNDYPIFNEEYRETLNSKIIRHYKYREIGFETIDLFVDRLSERMQLHMPMFNQLYETTLLSFNPLTTTNIVTDSEGTGADKADVSATSTTNAQSASTNDSKSRTVASDFPQALLQPNGDYATSANDAVAESGVSSTATEAGTQGTVQEGSRESASHTVMAGYTMSPSELLLRYRDTIINIDVGVIAVLDDLFMGIWNTSQEYGSYPDHYGNMYPFGLNLYGGIR